MTNKSIRIIVVASYKVKITDDLLYKFMSKEYKGRFSGRVVRKWLRGGD